jgi:branched-chain amino acid transport system substrate-binding protein
MKVSKKLLALAAVLVVVAMVATGCGSNGGSTSGGSTGGTAAGVTVKIGVGAPLTAGAVAMGEGMKRATDLAVKQANDGADAKAAGITFQVVAGDDQGDPKTGVTVANTFASDPALVGVMGHLNSGVSIPASKVYSDKKIVMISPASTNPDLTKQGLKNVFRVCTTDAVQGPAAADMVSKLGMLKAFVVDDSTPYGTGLADAFAGQIKVDGGTVLGREKTSDKDTDFNALVTKIKGMNPDVIYYGGIYNSGALLSKQAHDAGIKAPLLGGDGLYASDYIKLGGKGTEGDLCTSVGLPTDQMPKGQDFIAAYKAAYPNDEMQAYDAYSFDAANTIINAVVATAKSMGADKVTSPAGRDAIIAAVAATDAQGVTGQIKFDANGDTLNKTITLYDVKGGTWVPKANNLASSATSTTP